MSLILPEDGLGHKPPTWAEVRDMAIGLVAILAWGLILFFALPLLALEGR